MTIKDIAKLAGVSKSTVSRVLNDQPGVSEDARLKVIEVVKENNFVLNRSASMTKKNRKVFLVLSTRLDSYSETRLIRGMMEQANDDTEFLITETQFSITKTKEVISNNSNVNGIIVFAISGEDYSFLDDLLIPVVIVGQKVETNKSNFYFPDYESMHKLCQVQELKKPIFVGYNKDDNTMLNRYLAAKDANDGDLDKINMDSFGHVSIDSDITRYHEYICATESIALEVYKYILTNDIKDYKILSVGNNKQINFIVDNKVTIDYHNKHVGRYIIENLNNNKSFITCGEFDIYE